MIKKCDRELAERGKFIQSKEVMMGSEVLFKEANRTIYNLLDRWTGCKVKR